MLCRMIAILFVSFGTTAASHLCQADKTGTSSSSSPPTRPWSPASGKHGLPWHHHEDGCTRPASCNVQCYPTTSCRPSDPGQVARSLDPETRRCGGADATFRCTGAHGKAKLLAWRRERQKPRWSLGPSLPSSS